MNRRAVAAVFLAAATLAGCSGGSSGSTGGPAGAGASRTARVAPAAATPDGPVRSALGVTVRGAFGRRPVLEIPARTAPPTTRAVQVLAGGSGDTVRQGDLLVAGYHIQSWGAGAQKSATVEDSWARGVPTLGVAGQSSRTLAWGDLVVGRRLGSRLLVVVPADASWKPGGPPAKGPVAVVLDLLRVVPRVPAADGHPVKGRTARGFPQVSGPAGSAPVVTGLADVGSPKEPVSRLLDVGDGSRLQPGRTAVVHLVEIDVTTGKTVNSTWDDVPLLVPVRNLVSRVGALSAATLGSRAVAVLPASGAAHRRVLVVDVVDQV